MAISDLDWRSMSKDVPMSWPAPPTWLASPTPRNDTFTFQQKAGASADLTINDIRMSIRRLEVAAKPVGRIVLSDAMVERVLHARSPARARRRMARKGRKTYPQCYRTLPRRDVVTLQNGDMLVHPIVMDQIKREAVVRMDRAIGGAMLFGTPIVG